MPKINARAESPKLILLGSRISPFTAANIETVQVTNALTIAGENYFQIRRIEIQTQRLAILGH